MTHPFPFPPLRPEFLSVPEAAKRLSIDPETMLAWNMVLVLTAADGRMVVPAWCADPSVAAVMPILSEVFQGEALLFSLRHMDPCGDGRDGIGALLDGDWQAVHGVLLNYRRRMDQVMRALEVDRWLSSLREGKVPLG